MRNNSILVLLFLLLFAAVPARAHPLGNFSVNNFSRVRVEAAAVRVRCVLDMAEIPAFQESRQIDRNQNGALEQAELDAYLETLAAQYAANLTLAVDDQPLALRVESKTISQPLGSANLPTLRAEFDFAADLPGASPNAVRRLRFENRNFTERVGWNEIAAGGAANISVFDSDAFGDSLSDELRNYPEDLLNAPLAERSTQMSFAAAKVVVGGAPLKNRDGKISQPAPKDSFAALISVERISASIVLLGLLAAFGLGAAHALSPGHGKAVVGAYLVGSRGTLKHAAFLGLTVTVTHTIGVFALGLITLFAARFVLPERLMPILSFVSGFLVLLIGLSLLKNRLPAMLGYESREAHEHDALDFDALDANKALTHTHGGNTHSHAPPRAVTWRSLFALGVSGGLLPCSSALVLMLAAINLDRIGYGLLLTTAFSLGLATTLTGIGLIFLYFGRLFDNPTFGANPFVKALPVFGAFVVACVGAIICYNSLL